MQPRSTRLNSSNRAEFVTAVIEKNLPDRKRPTDTDFKNRWADKIYKIAYGDYLERMKALPKWFFAESTDIQVEFTAKNVYSTTMSFDVPNNVLTLNPNSGHSYQNHKVVTKMPIPEDHKITKDFIQHRQAQTDYKLKQEKLRKQVGTLVQSCNTSGQLYKAWPEAIEYAECFPYKGPNRHTGADVSAMEMDIQLKVSKANIVLPEIE